MAELLHALCLSMEPAAANAVADAVAALPDFAVTTRTADYEGGLGDLQAPDLVVVDLGASPALGLAVIETLHRTAPATQVLALSPDEDADTVVRALRAGADDHLGWPLDPLALRKVCIKVAERRRLSRANGRSAGDLWVAYSPKGGVGVTTLVANLGVALAATGRSVALVDLDVHAGDLALFLNLAPTSTLRELVNNFDRLDPVLLCGAMVRHPSGLQLLASPAVAMADAALAITRDQTIAVLELLAAAHAVTLLDTPAVPTDATRAALTSADRVLLVTELTVPALRGCLRTIDWLREQDVDPLETVDVVVNKYADRPSEISPAEASRTLGLPLRVLLPRDDKAARAASNTGMPLSDVRGGEALQRAIATLVERRAPQTVEPRRRGLLRFFTAAEWGA